MNVVDLIERKRDGATLTQAEIEWLIAAYTSDEVPDYQMAAMTMAVFLRGLDGSELAAWTGAMLHSGEVLDLSGVDLPKVDKHSTGGVGDKVSIPLAPIVASCGVAVPMMSGRGLGHTGGTLDKLESIPGLSTQLDAAGFRRVLDRCGFAMAGQTASLVPADRKLYALRDATGTVASIPLIASSIMSKKLAEDLDGLVLDVKCGKGAFMTQLEPAQELARTMVGIGNSHGVEATALITNMDQPLGRMVGNSNEIAESIEVLKGGGPDDLVEITRALAEEMLDLAGLDGAEASVQRAIDSGDALERFARMVEEQGGNPAVVDDPTLLPFADETTTLTADGAGVVVECDSRLVGLAAMRLGAGRTRTDDEVDPGVGIEVVARRGTVVRRGDPLAVLRHRRSDLSEALELAKRAWVIGDEAPATAPMVWERISSADF